ncbi:hypothetical protein Bbelb_445430 [Branchiostoma belcheri]|nr:hypothetical protein Bbelb_445430 [Branchiostoma belcheri]
MTLVFGKDGQKETILPFQSFEREQLDGAKSTISNMVVAEEEFEEPISALSHAPNSLETATTAFRCCKSWVIEKKAAIERVVVQPGALLTQTVCVPSLLPACPPVQPLAHPVSPLESKASVVPGNGSYGKRTYGRSFK